MWFIFALATSICAACYYLCNQNCKLKPDIFIVYRGFIVALLVLPITLFIAPSFAWPFFLIAILQGFAVSYLDYNIYKLFQKYGAEAVSSIQPLSVLLTFVLWLIIRPDLLFLYMENIKRFIIIVLCISAIVYAVMKYRRQSFVFACLCQMVPLLLICSFIDITNKLIMEYTNNHFLQASLYRVLIVSSVVGFVNLGLVTRQGTKIKTLLKKENILASWFVVLLPFSMVLINFSAYFAENPAYSSVIVYLSVVWILLFNKIRQFFGRPQKYKTIEKKWIILLLAATMILVIVTSG